MKPKAHYLKALKLDEISLVDKGANVGAKVVLSKREMPIEKKVVEENGKFCAMGADGKKLGTFKTKAEAEAQLADENTDTTNDDETKEGFMAKIDLSKLAPEVVAHIAEIEKKLTDATAKDADVLIAKAKADAEERVSKAEATAKEAVELAKSERETRLAREYTEKVSVFKRLPIDKTKDGAFLREIDEKCSPECAKRLTEILKATDAAMVEANILMTQIGTSGSETGSAHEQLTAIGKKLVGEGKAATIEKGYTMAMAQHPDLGMRAQREALNN